MFHRLFHRALSLALSAVLTLGMLGSIDHLAQPDEGGAQWAQHTTHRA